MEPIVPAHPEGNPACPDGEGGRAMLSRMNAGKHEQLANWGLDHLSLSGARRALDLGCGGGANLGRLLARMAFGGFAAGLDYSELSVEVSRETNATAIAEGRCEVVLGDVSRLPFEDGSFDVVTGFETVYFWPDVEGALSEALRVLKPGGVLLICNEVDGEDPAMVEFARTVEGMSVYTASELESFMSKAGFSDVQADRDPQTGHMCAIGMRP